ncbi:hypothetical protein V1514DRAFT_329330 [Lipomyces japonicus]|uniref:uncharacterized protein n=1 Tax=Lipomyces japonicus TaxID=56871 RepID=UPI0034CF1864
MSQSQSQPQSPSQSQSEQSQFPAAETARVQPPQQHQLPQTQYRHYGRGGFGNVTSKPQADFSPAPVQVFTSPQQTFHRGRGGYGNVQPIDNLATMTPDQYLKEVDHAFEVRRGDVFKIGRGGSGNIIVEGDDPAAAAAAATGQHGGEIENEPVSPLPRLNETDQNDGFFTRMGRRLSSGTSRSRSREPRLSSHSRSKSRRRESADRTTLERKYSS